MKLLIITKNYPPSKGGMSVSCDRLVRNFRNNAIETHVIHFTNRRKKFVTQSMVNGTYTAIPIQNSEEFTLSLASEFILQLSFLKEITHIAAFGGNLPINLAPILAKWTSKKLITFIRGNDFDEGVFSKRRDNLLYALENSDYVFSVTNEKKEKINSLVTHNNTYFTPNGINCSLWEISSSHVDKIQELKQSFQDKTPIAIVGQLKEKKGILNFTETFSKFPYKDEYVICMIGDVSSETKQILDNLDVNVNFYPFANQNDLLLFYHAVNIIAIPSFYDGMPNVLLEAGATKNLIIGANIGGIKDVISDNSDGFLYNPLNPLTLLDLLLKVHRLTEEEKDKISSSLLNKIKTSYTEEKEISTYLNILKT
ncbi:glycosyltransferase family 4 protein [Tenacibaculum jejuense]|uniref:Glycosyltransferase, family GT4 n=1 Tax=Tenacibaculum jejuense TaxID=584609 RepID=A0A238UDJ6_9FLAO|nr:glycosyltransferase [Tenacibaculum jejuense]SNR16480.1 Glycosyltransferase, family GT4 [Tenacibaculum jejuense]